MLLSSVVTARDNAYYGQGTGPILLDEVGCDGTESRLLDCPNIGIGNNDCGHIEDAGVSCLTSTTVTSPPGSGGGGTECSDEGRVVNYFNYTYDGLLSQYEGTFEICIGGFYGSICDIGWDQAAAQQVCREQISSSYSKLNFTFISYCCSIIISLCSPACLQLRRPSTE